MFGKGTKELEQKPVDMKKEFERYTSQRMRILNRLKEGELTTRELARIAFDYTARVSELRKDGHKIVSIYEKPGVWRYVYLGKEDD